MLKKLNSQKKSANHSVKGLDVCRTLCKAQCGFGVTFAVGYGYQMEG